MAIKNRYCTFVVGEFFAVPYRHHKNRLIWNVEVGGSAYCDIQKVVADSAHEAAFKAIANFQKTYNPSAEDYL